MSTAQTLPEIDYPESDGRPMAESDLHRLWMIRIGVQELFLFDPTADYLRPPLQGFRFVDGHSEPIAPAADGALECRTLGLTLRLESGGLAMFDATTGERLLTEAESQRLQTEFEHNAKESERAAKEAERAVKETERAARLAAEDGIRRLRAELARLQPPAD